MSERLGVDVAVDEIAVERRVDGDLIAAAHVARGRLTGAECQAARQGEHHEEAVSGRVACARTTAS
jgi:L-fucose isomerase-like protein